MITESMIYWITRMTIFHDILCTMGGIFLVVGLIGWIISKISLHYNKGEAEQYDSNKRLIPMCTYLVKASLIFWLIGALLTICGIFTPTTKEMCAIKVIPAIANSEQVQEIPNDILGLAKEWIEELKPDKEKTDGSK